MGKIMYRDNEYAGVPTVNYVDYIVEQGTEGIWTYRKWNSGVAECWGTQPSTSYAMTQGPWGTNSGYYCSVSINYPTGLFVSAPVYSAFKGSSAAGLAWISCAGNTTSTVTLYLADCRSNTAAFTIVLHAIGRWK